MIRRRSIGFRPRSLGFGRSLRTICHCPFVRLLEYFRDIDIATAPSLGLKHPGAVAIFIFQRNFKTRSETHIGGIVLDLTEFSNRCRKGRSFRCWHSDYVFVFALFDETQATMMRGPKV